jgi:GNAT superfamily N-acetyltransferase
LYCYEAAIPRANSHLAITCTTFSKAILMARLAVDQTAQGQGLGRSLLVDALERTWSVMQNGAAPVRLFVVDAKDEEAKAFYERFGMLTSPANPMRLFLSYKTLSAILEVDL